MSTLDDIRARDAGWKENIANCNYESHAPLSAEGTSQIIGDRRYLLGLVDALTKFAEFCDYHHRSCTGLQGQHLECDCGYTDARDELRAAFAKVPA